MKKDTIAVVGGGLSGLLLAYRLAGLGHKVTIFEQNSFIGGELSTIRTGSAWPIERFYHHIFLYNQNIVNLYKELGLEDTIRWYKSSIAVYKESSIYPFSSAIDLLRLPFLPLLTKIKIGIGTLVIPRLNYQKFETVTAKQMITGFMGATAWDEFWEPMFRLKFSDYSEKISGAWFWGRLRERTLSRSGQEILGYPDGGFQALLDRLVDELNIMDVQIRLDTKVENVDKTYDKVICATPLPIGIKSPPVNYLSVITVILETSEKITDQYWTNILDEEILFSVIVEHTNLVPAENYGTNLLYLGKYLDINDKLYTRSDEEIYELFISSLEKIHPGVKKKILKYHVCRDDYAQPIIQANYKKPDYEASVLNLYYLSSSQIYPYDRGLDRVCSEVDNLINLLI